MSSPSPPPEIEAFQLMAAGRFAEALFSPKLRGFAGAICSTTLQSINTSLQRFEEVFPKSLLAATSPDASSSRFIFIVGLPRSGTTLLEHMLLGLAGVRSNGETENFSHA